MTGYTVLKSLLKLLNTTIPLIFRILISAITVFPNIIRTLSQYTNPILVNNNSEFTGPNMLSIRSQLTLSYHYTDEVMKTSQVNNWMTSHINNWTESPNGVMYLCIVNQLLVNCCGGSRKGRGVLHVQ